MKIRNYLLAAVAALTMGMSSVSCSSDILEHLPENSYIEDNFYESDEALMASTASLYCRAWFDYNSLALLLMGACLPNDVYYRWSWPSYTRFQVTALDQELGDIWKSFYSVVTLSNATLANIKTKCGPDVSELARNTAMGEARLMRGIALFWAMHIWGPVIVFEDNQTVVDNPVQPKIVEEDIFKFVINDLTAASELLPEKPSEPGRATSYSAKGMLAKVYLARSSWFTPGERNAEDLAKCKELCLDVINNGPYSLLPDYENLFKYRYNNNQECMLAMQWYKSATMTWYAGNTNLSDLAFSSDVIGGAAAWANGRMTMEMAGQYKYLDDKGQEHWEGKRMWTTWFVPGHHYDYINIADGGYTYAADNTSMPPKKGVPGGPDDDNDGFVSMMNSPLNTYIQRLADVYLMYAEACLGDSPVLTGEGLQYFNAVRSRVEEATVSSITFEDIMRERRVEFGMEYSTWYDFMSWYHWKPEFMLNFLNNQMRTYGFELSMGPNGEIIIDPESIEEPSDVVSVVTHDNIHLPFPESDVIQNPLLKQDQVRYNF